MTSRLTTGDAPRLARVRLLLTCLVLMASVLAIYPAPSGAHRDGCHRWHSCPSDTGSYVCGDLGYFSQCPGYVPPAGTTPAATPAAAPLGSAPPDGSSFQVGQGSGISFSVESAVASPRVTISKDTTTDSYGILTGGYPVALTPTPAGGTSYAGTLPWTVFSGIYTQLTVGTYHWQAYAIDATGCVTSGCYLVSPVMTFVVLAAPAPVTPVAAPTTSQDAAVCRDARRKRDRLASEVAGLRRQLKHASSRARRARLRHKLNARRASLLDARDDVAINC
jgi:hypothetical protein